MRVNMNQKFSISLKQKVDGQVQVTRIRVPKESLIDDPFLKEKIKNEMERLLKENGIKVLKDRGIIEYEGDYS